MRYVPYVHPRLDSILELCRIFPNESHSCSNVADLDDGSMNHKLVVEHDSSSLLMLFHHVGLF